MLGKVHGEGGREYKRSGHKCYMLCYLFIEYGRTGGHGDRGDYVKPWRSRVSGWRAGSDKETMIRSCESEPKRERERLQKGRFTSAFFPFLCLDL